VLYHPIPLSVLIMVLYNNTNATIVNLSSVVLEETHYYPFGLTMAGISSKALGKLENRYKFNEGSELNNELDLGWYESVCRTYDPQMKVFTNGSIVIFAKHTSLYAYVNNNPILFNDPLGLISTPTNPDVLPTVTVVGLRALQDIRNSANQAPNSKVTYVPYN
jgi:RHS repeat-associated protein